MIDTLWWFQKVGNICLFRFNFIFKSCSAEVLLILSNRFPTRTILLTDMESSFLHKLFMTSQLAFPMHARKQSKFVSTCTLRPMAIPFVVLIVVILSSAL